MTIKKDLFIIGSGPAGYSAAVYAARAGLDFALITGYDQGGQLMTTKEVENWPGGHGELEGPELMQNLLDHVKRLDVEVIHDQIQKTTLTESPFILQGDESTYECRALIIATGASAKYLGLPAEKAFMGKGVSACATCDGFFYRNRVVTVVGGGNTAAEEALYLANIASHVHLIHRRQQLRADHTLTQRVLNKVKEGKMTVHWDHVLHDIVGDDQGVNGIDIQHVNTEAITRVDTWGVFIAIGHTPNTQLFTDQLEMKHGYLQVKGGAHGNATATSIPGVFACGDVMDAHYRQAITSAGTGCMAALDAEKYLSQ